MYSQNYLFVLTIINITIRLYPAFIIGREKMCNNGSLVLLHVLFRHGDRTPDLSEIYPNDPYANKSYHPLGYGDLTNIGKAREFLIGKTLRQIYNKFLGIYTTDAAYARSTDYGRTKMSCELVLAGLYPPADKQKWNNGLDWQPIPFDYEDLETDRLLGDPRYNFPRYIQLYNGYLDSIKGRMLRTANLDLYNYLTIQTGWDIKQPREVYNLYFVLKSEQSLGLKLPPWTRPVWPEHITHGAVQEYKVSTATDELKKLSGGFLLRKIINDTIAKIQGAEDLKQRKIFLYSGHENNIAYLLTLLDVFYPHVPPFGAYVILEVRQIGGIYGFMVYYQDYSRLNRPKLLKLPNCDAFCPIAQFIELVKDYLPGDNDV